MRPLSLALVLLAVPLLTHAAEFRVGPGQTHASIGTVPWEALGPGDTVLIHARPTPYAEKWVIGRSGTAQAPITVRGVPDAQGNPPVIVGENATTRTQLDYWGEQRGIVKIGGSSIPAATAPAHIVIEGLHLRRARGGYTDDAGAAGTYAANAAALYIEAGRHLVIRDCILEDSGNGLFIAPNTADVLVEGNTIRGNGNVDSILEHNAYTEALGIVYQYNHFGPLCTGCPGNNLKDRSAGTVVRYNWIEGGNRQLDLVDSDNATYRADPAYAHTFVYGNVLLEPEGAGNRQIVHFGGDSGATTNYRGTLYLWNNTVVSSRTDRTTLVRLSSNAQSAQVTGNIVFVTAAGTTLALTDEAGTLRHGGNWYKPGYVSSFGTVTGSVTDTGGNVTGSDPGFVSLAQQDFHLLPSAPVRGLAVAPPAETSAHPLLRQYVKHRQSEPRPESGLRDIGAYGSAAPPGEPDGGTGTPDAGSGADAGTQPLPSDAGTSEQDGGEETPSLDADETSGCGCGSTGGAPLALLALMLLGRREHRGSAPGQRRGPPPLGQGQ